MDEIDMLDREEARRWQDEARRREAPEARV